VKFLRPDAGSLAALHDPGTKVLDLQPKGRSGAAAAEREGEPSFRSGGGVRTADPRLP
jgi:hypothetical protein